MIPYDPDGINMPIQEITLAEAKAMFPNKGEAMISEDMLHYEADGTKCPPKEEI